MKKVEEQLEEGVVGFKKASASPSGAVVELG